MGAENGAGPSGGSGTAETGTGPARIAALDVLRGVAVLGILLINITVFALPPGAQVLSGDPAAAGMLDFSAWAFSEVFVEGTMRALFSMLFGASMLLMTGTVRLAAAVPATPAVDLYARRSLWLVGFGLVHAYVLLWPHDILYAYGLLGLLLLPLRVLKPRLLLLAGLLMLAMVALISSVGDTEPDSVTSLSRYGVSNGASESVRFAALPEGMADVTPPYEEIRLSAAQAEAQDAIDTRRSGYWDNFLDMAPETADLQSEEFYQTNLFDIGGMMLIGMALLKFGVLTGRRSRRFYWAMLAATYGVGLAVNGWQAWASVTPAEETAKLVYWSEVTYDLGRLPTALGHVAAIMLLMNLRIFSTAARLLTAAGRLALTNYVMQTMICNTLFLGAGFGLYGTLKLHQLMLIAAAIWAGQIAFSLLWLRRYRLGPLEWALRSLVHWSPQPLRHRLVTGVPLPSAAAGR